MGRVSGRRRYWRGGCDWQRGCGDLEESAKIIHMNSLPTHITAIYISASAKGHRPERKYFLAGVCMAH